ncbi:MAG: hypothetical protein NT118_07835, partial [Lentisphaerae bacterium]|nr:hypothetical protein [Lentisphaerota bacterium]
DRILLNTYKALDYFALGSAADANVELRRAYERQKEAEKKFADEIKKQEEENKKEGAKAGKQVTFEGLEKEHPEVKKSFDDMKKQSNKTYGNLMNPFVTYMSGMRYLLDKNYPEADVDFRKNTDRPAHRLFGNSIFRPGIFSSLNRKPGNYGFRRKFIQDNYHFSNGFGRVPGI